MSVEMGLDISLGGWGRSVIFFDGEPAKLGGSGADYAPDYAHHFEEDCPGITW
jgi:hypothetical protein